MTLYTFYSLHLNLDAIIVEIVFMGRSRCKDRLRVTLDCHQYLIQTSTMFYFDVDVDNSAFL